MRKRLHTQREKNKKKKGNVKTEGEIEVMQPPTAEKARRGHSPELPEGVWPCQHLDFCPLNLMLNFWPLEQ